MALTVLSVAYPLAPVGPDAVGGAEQILTRLDAALVAAGHRSIVVACEGSVAAGDLVAIPAETGALDEPARHRARRAVVRAIAAVRDRHPVDLVHLHGIDFADYRPEGLPVLATLHLPLDWYPAEVFAPRPGLHLHPVSAAQAATAPAGARLLAPIPNGVPVPDRPSPHARRRFALNLGRICPEKGVHLALDAAARAGVPLVIGGQVFGYDAHRDYFEHEVRPRLGGARRFAGPLGARRKARFLAAARCLLVPSLARETSSLVAMEALAAGTPVIAFPTGALPEIVEPGRTGFLVRDVGEMADAIAAADRIDPETCRAAARTRFSLAAMERRYLDLYAAIAEGRVG